MSKKMPEVDDRWIDTTINQQFVILKLPQFPLRRSTWVILGTEECRVDVPLLCMTQSGEYLKLMDDRISPVTANDRHQEIEHTWRHQQTGEVYAVTIDEFMARFFLIGSKAEIEKHRAMETGAWWRSGTRGGFFMKTNKNKA